MNSRLATSEHRDQTTLVGECVADEYLFSAFSPRVNYDGASVARINIEESWWSDVRRTKLIKVLGSEELADGVALRLWRIAQTFWHSKKENRHIPSHVWNEFEHADAIIRCGLATIDASTGEVYVRGASDNFGWIDRKQNNGSIGGKISAERRKEKYGTAKPLSKDVKNTRSKREAPVKCREADVKHPEASNSNSNSNSNSKKNTHTSTAGCVQLSPRALLEVWNENCGSLPKAKDLSEKRRRVALQRVTEKPDRQAWVDVVRSVASSDFCNGRVQNSSGWVATFDWLLQPDTFLKVVEGKYSNRERSVSDPPDVVAQILSRQQKELSDGY